MEFKSESYGQTIAWNDLELPLWFSKPMRAMAGEWYVDVGNGICSANNLRELASLIDEMNEIDDMYRKGN